MANRGGVWFGTLAAGAVALTLGCGDGRSDGSATPGAGEGAPDVPPAAVDKEQAMVRLINLVPEGGPLTIWSGDSAAFAGIAYKDVTAYRLIAEDMFNFQIRSGGVLEGEALAENKEVIDVGHYYTIVALPAVEAAGRNLRVLEDNPGPQSEGKARLRFINGVPGEEDVDVLIRGREEPLFDGVDFATEAGWSEVDPVTGTMVVRPDDQKTTLATLSNVQLQPGRTYTFVLAGRPGQKYEVIKIDEQVPEHQETGAD